MEMGNKELWRNTATHDKIVHPLEQNWIHVRHCVCVDAMDSGCALRCAWVRYTNSAHALRCAPTQHILCTAQHPSAKDSTAHTHTLLRSRSLAKKLFLNSGFLTSIRERKNDRQSPPSLCGHSLLDLIQYFTHSAFSGLGTGTVVASNDGGSIMCLFRDPFYSRHLVLTVCLFMDAFYSHHLVLTMIL